MIVYVESNYVLELAFLQEQAQACEELLQMAERERIRLVLPAFSIAEPYDTLNRRRSARSRLQDELFRELRELRRSEPYRELSDRTRDLAGILTASSAEEAERLDSVLARVLQISAVVPLTAEVFLEAREIQRRVGLPSKDALVYASVLHHATLDALAPKVFLNRNGKDFLNPTIQEELAALNCDLIDSFTAAIGRLRGPAG